jgi:hypothetical protein
MKCILAEPQFTVEAQPSPPEHTTNSNTGRPQAGAATSTSALRTEESGQEIISHFGARNRFPAVICVHQLHSLKSSGTSPLSFDNAIGTGRISVRSENA